MRVLHRLTGWFSSQPLGPYRKLHNLYMPSDLGPNFLRLRTFTRSLKNPVLLYL